MPSTAGVTLGDFFTKKSVKKKKQTEEDEEVKRREEQEEKKRDEDAPPMQEEEEEVEKREAVADEKAEEELVEAEPQEVEAADAENENVTVAAAPSGSDPSNGKLEADIAYRDGAVTEEVEEEQEEQEQEPEEQEEEEEDKQQEDQEAEEVVKEYPAPSRTERRIDPEDGESYIFDEFVLKNCEAFSLEEIVEYWFDEMTVEETEDRVPGAVGEGETAGDELGELEDEEAGECGEHAAEVPPETGAAGAVGSDSMVIDTGCAQGAGPGQDFVVNHREAVEIYTTAPGGAAHPRLLRSLSPVQSADALIWSVDGRFLGILSQHSLQVLEVASDYELLCELLPQAGERSQGMKAFHFSPAGSYAVLYEPTDRGDSNVDSEVNLRVWQLDTEPVQACAFYLDRRAETVWPALKWTPDEQWCCRIVKDGVQVFDGDALTSSSTSGMITCEGVNAFEVSPTSEESDSKSAYVALFVPDRKGNPARCFVYSLSNLSEPTAIQEVAHAHNSDIRWNHTGTAVLFLTSTDVDDTGASYYGNTMLYFISADGSYATEVATSDVHDVEWSPVADEFLLLSGSLPCEMTLHDGRKAEQQMTFGQDYRNKIQWGPFGRFFAFGGFKTLKGDIDFWDRSSRYLLGRSQYECCVDCQWSPDGRLLLGSTTAPRMRVDNRIEIFDYVGNRLSKIPFKELYSASWRPMPGCFEDRPETPGRSKLTDRDHVEQTSHVPNSGSSGFADRLRAERQGRSRTKAMTREEQEAELAAVRKERLEEKEREKLAEQRARRTAEVAKQPTPQEFREVIIPEELVGGIIGPKGATIRELKKETNYNLELNKDPATGDHRLVIGPAHPWDDLDKAVATIHSHMEELRAKQDGKGKGSRKGEKGSGKGSVREIWIPEDLVGGIIGSKGSTIEEIRKKAGGPSGVNLWVLPPKDGEEQRKVAIGPGDPETLNRAEELIQAKLEELRQAAADLKGGKGGGQQGKGGKSGGKEGKDGKSSERGDNGWNEKARTGGKEPGGRKGGWEKGSDGLKGGKRDVYDQAAEDSRSYARAQGFQLDETSFGPSLADAMRKASKENLVVEARRQPAEGPWSEDKGKSRMESAWAEDRSKGKSDASWTEEAHATKTSWADVSAQEGTWAEWSEDIGEWEEDSKGRHDSSWVEEKPKARSEGKWVEDKGRSSDARWSEDKSRSRMDGSWAEDKPKGKRDGQWTEDKMKSRGETAWSDDRNKGRDDGKWSDDKNRNRGDGTWSEDKKKGRSDGKWSEERSKGKTDGSWLEEKSKGRSDKWTEEKSKSRGDGSWSEDKNRGRGESSWKESKGKGRGDNSWTDDRGKGRSDNSWSDDRGKNKGDTGWSEDRSKGRAETSWSDDKSRGRGDNSWTEEKGKVRGQSDRDRGKGKSENANGWSSKWGTGDRPEWTPEQELPSQSKRSGGNRSDGTSYRAGSAQDLHSSAAGGGSRAASGSATSASAAAPENARDVAFAALRDGDLQRAKQLFDKVLRQNSRDEHALVGRSEVCLLLGDANKSLLDATTAKRINAKFHAAWLRKAKAEEVLGRTQDAEASYREAHRLEATSPAKAAAPAKSDGEREYVCSDCGQSPDLGAIDPEDGNWYCKACWEAMYQAEQEEEAMEEEQAPEKARAPEKEQASDRQQAASERPQAADARTSFMPKDPFGAARRKKT